MVVVLRCCVVFCFVLFKVAFEREVLRFSSSVLLFVSGDEGYLQLSTDL